MGKQFNEIAKDVSNFGHLSVKEMTKLSAVMLKTGISMSTVVGVAKQFDQFDQGAQAVAKLTQAFGMQLNAVDLLNASDEERMQMLKSSFQATGKSIEDLSRQERQYLAASAGIAEGDLERVFGDQAGAIDETATAAEKAQQAQMDSAASLKEMAKSIRSIFAPVQTFMGMFDAFFRGFKRGFTTNNEFLKKFQATLNKVFKIGLELGAWLNVFLNDSTRAKGAFDAIFDLEGQVSFFQLISDSLKELLTGEKTLTQVFEGFVEHFKPKLLAAWEGLKYVFAKIGEFLSSPPVVAALSEGAAALIEVFKKVLANPKVQAGLMSVGSIIVGLMIGKAVVGAMMGAIGKGVIKGLAMLMGGGAGPGDVAGGVNAAGDVINAANKIEWKTIGKALVILGALGGMIILGLKPFANAIEAAGQAVSDTGLKRGTAVLGAMVLSLLAMTALVFATMPLGAALSGPQGLAVGIGLLAAMVLLPIVGAFGVLLINIMGDVPAEKAIKAVKFFGSIALIFGALAALFVGAAVIGGAAVLGGAFLVEKGMNAIEGIAQRIAEFVPDIMASFFESTAQWSATEVEQRVGTVIDLITALADFASMFTGIIDTVAGMDLKGEQVNKAFMNMGTLFEKLGSTMKGSINHVRAMAQNIKKEDIPGIESAIALMGGIGTALGGIAGVFDSIRQTQDNTITRGMGLRTNNMKIGAITMTADALKGLVSGMLDPLIESMTGTDGAITKLKGITITGDEITKIKGLSDVMVSLADAMGKMGAIGQQGMINASWAQGELLNNVQWMINNIIDIHNAYIDGDSRSSAAGGLLAVVQGVAEDTNLITDALNGLGEGISLTASIDKINKGLSSGSSKIRLEAQKVTLNISVDVKLDADKLAEGLSKDNIVSKDFVLSRANPAAAT